MRILLFITILFLFVSCDKSFDASSPLSYDKSGSKIEGKCKSNTDCEEGFEVCDINKKTCVENPCYDTLTKSTNTICGTNGECIPQFHEDSVVDKICKCNDGYDTFLNPETDKAEFICKKNCDNLLSCKEDDHKVSCTQDKYSVITCSCSDDYKQTEDGICINPCKDISCGSNEHCVANNDLTTNCVCDDNYFPNPSNSNICESPCAGHENCSLDNIEKLGLCTATGLGIESVTCDCVINMEVDESNPLLCILNNIDDPCKNISCGSYGNCENQSGIAVCNCQSNYLRVREGTNEQTCIRKCDTSDCTNGTCNDSGYETDGITISDKKYCECNEGFQDTNKDLVCNISCSHPDVHCIQEHGGICGWDDGNNGYLDGNIECFCPEGYSQSMDKTNCIWNGYVWTITMEAERGSTELNASYGNGKSIAVDSNGNIYSIGVFIGTIDFNYSTRIDKYTSMDFTNQGGSSDLFITKTNNDGSYAWTKTIGTRISDYDLSVMLDSYDNIYIKGIGHGVIDFNPSNKNVDIHSSREMTFITKLNSDGSYGWTKTIPNVRGHSIAFDSNQNIYIAGSFSNTVDFNSNIDVDTHTANGNNDIFVTKLDDNGNYLWTKTIGGANNDYAISIVLDVNDNIYIAGIFEGTVDFNPFTEIDTNISNGSYDIFITKLNSDASYAWTKTIGGEGEDLLNSVAIDTNSDIYLTGSFHETVDFNPSDGVDFYASNGERDIFVSKLSFNGNYLWTKTIGGVNNDYAFSIVLDISNNIYIKGSIYDKVDFNTGSGVDEHGSGGYSEFITKLNMDSSYAWTKVIMAEQFRGGFAIDLNNNIYTIGSFKGSVDFDPSEGVDNHDAMSTDIFISKYSQKKLICNNINCNNYGTCQVDTDNNPFCTCNTGYQDNEPDLYCEPSCENPNINNCGSHGSCDDSSGNVVCLCDVGYALDGNFQCDECDYGFHDDSGVCVMDTQVTCSDITCSANTHCITQNNNSGCVCDDGFHLNGNFQCIAD